MTRHAWGDGWKIREITGDRTRLGVTLGHGEPDRPGTEHVMARHELEAFANRLLSICRAMRDPMTVDALFDDLFRQHADAGPPEHNASPSADETGPDGQNQPVGEDTGRHTDSKDQPVGLDAGREITPNTGPHDAEPPLGELVAETECQRETTRQWEPPGGARRLRKTYPNGKRPRK